jgi:hypothetical protein
LKVEISKDLLWEDLEGEVVILDLTSGTYLGLDPVGSRIWRLLSEFQAIEAVIGAMLAEYDVEETVLRHDVGALVRRLSEKSLLKFV